MVLFEACSLRQLLLTLCYDRPLLLLCTRYTNSSEAVHAHHMYGYLGFTADADAR